MVVRRGPIAPDAPIDLTHKVLPVDADVKAKHVWGPAPAGQGGKSQRICRKCGQRQSVVGKDSTCPDRHSGAMAETQYDYDPFE